MSRYFVLFLLISLRFGPNEFIRNLKHLSYSTSVILILTKPPLPVGKVSTEFTSPIAKSTSPRLSDTTFFGLFAHWWEILPKNYEKFNSTKKKGLNWRLVLWNFFLRQCYWLYVLRVCVYCMYTSWMNRTEPTQRGPPLIPLDDYKQVSNAMHVKWHKRPNEVSSLVFRLWIINEEVMAR